MAAGNLNQPVMFLARSCSELFAFLRGLLASTLLVLHASAVALAAGDSGEIYSFYKYGSDPDVVVMFKILKGRDGRVLTEVRPGHVFLPAEYCNRGTGLRYANASLFPFAVPSDLTAFSSEWQFMNVRFSLQTTIKLRRTQLYVIRGEPVNHDPPFGKYAFTYVYESQRGLLYVDKNVRVAPGPSEQITLAETYFLSNRSDTGVLGEKDVDRARVCKTPATS